MDRTTVERIDDMDSKSPADERVRFGLDGKRYVIDLTADRAAGLRKALEPYVTAGRKDEPETASKPRPRRSPNADRNTAVRAWAATQGIKVSERGQLPADVIAKYDAAHRTGQAPARSAATSAPAASAPSPARASQPAPAGSAAAR